MMAAAEITRVIAAVRTGGMPRAARLEPARLPARRALVGDQSDVDATSLGAD